MTAALEYTSASGKTRASGGMQAGMQVPLECRALEFTSAPPTELTYLETDVSKYLRIRRK